MRKIKNHNIFLGILGLAVLIFIFLLIILFGKVQKEETVKIGFVMSGGMEEAGWNGIHYQGINAVCEEFGVQLSVKEHVEEFTGQCPIAIAELVDEGADMIILSSYGYSEEVKDIVAEYPEITFYVSSSEYHAENMSSYFARMYQVRYLSGIIAGLKTEGNKIGYVAAMPNNEVNRGIDAFTLGVKSVNEDARVIVNWTGTWDDEQIEKEAAMELIEDAGVDVITYHQNQNYVVQAAEEAGVASIGFHQQFEGFSENYLTSVVYDWHLVYRELVRQFLKGKENSHNNYWVGIEKGAVKLTEYSSEVTEEMKEAVEKAKEEILTGKQIFSGVVCDNEGNLRCGENEVISDEKLLEQLDWYVEGVEFYE